MIHFRKSRHPARLGHASLDHRFRDAERHRRPIPVRPAMSILRAGRSCNRSERHPGYRGAMAAAPTPSRTQPRRGIASMTTAGIGGQRCRALQRLPRVAAQIRCRLSVRGHRAPLRYDEGPICRTIEGTETCRSRKVEVRAKTASRMVSLLTGLTITPNIGPSQPAACCKKA
jgi:hypothetical protein